MNLHVKVGDKVQHSPLPEIVFEGTIKDIFRRRHPSLKGIYYHVAKVKNDYDVEHNIPVINLTKLN